MFKDNIKELEELRKDDQEIVDKELDSFVKSLKADIQSKDYNYIMNQSNYSNNSLLKKLGINKNDDILYMSLVLLIIAVLGLINIRNFPIYLFGLVFFAAGLFVGLYVKGFGIIFLFSHGGVGFGMMIYALLLDRFSESSLTDLSFNMKIYLGIMVLMIIGGFLGVIIYNLSETLNKNKYNKIFPLIILGLALFLVGMIPLVRF